jgi:hypothetical protein
MPTCEDRNNGVEGEGGVLRSKGRESAKVVKCSGSIAATSKLKLRFSLWHNRLPVDALPVEGWIELQLLSEWELAAGM